MRLLTTICFGLFIASMSTVTKIAFADNHQAGCSDGTGTSGRLCNPLSSINSIPAFFQAILDIVMVFAIPFIVFFLIYAGFLYVMAQGKPEQIAKAHSALLYALIGGVLILAANLLLDIVTGTVNQFTN